MSDLFQILNFGLQIPKCKLLRLQTSLSPKVFFLKSINSQKWPEWVEIWLNLGPNFANFGFNFSQILYSGAQIYGRVQVDPVQSLGSGFSVHIEKVFLCSGRDGYIPKYQPANSEYGCLADAPNLLYRFKVIVSTT